jgi:hypothetical protein
MVWSTQDRRGREDMISVRYTCCVSCLESKKFPPSIRLPIWGAQDASHVRGRVKKPAPQGSSNIPQRGCRQSSIYALVVSRASTGVVGCVAFSLGMTVNPVSSAWAAGVARCYSTYSSSRCYGISIFRTKHSPKRCRGRTWSMVMSWAPTKEPSKTPSTPCKQACMGPGKGSFDAGELLLVLTASLHSSATREPTTRVIGRCMICPSSSFCGFSKPSVQVM